MILSALALSATTKVHKYLPLRSLNFVLSLSFRKVIPVTMAHTKMKMQVQMQKNTHSEYMIQQPNHKGHQEIMRNQNDLTQVYRK
jgi:hypothetical protein